MVGQNVGKYRVLDRIGRGGMGTVYRSIDETLHREVAIKVLNAELNDPDVARRFRAEAITVARLSHPGIATIYELFQHDGQWLMVMEFVRGETLEHLVERSGAQTAERAAELCLHSLAALAHAHAMGVVHRDLKPANIMLTESGVIKIMDFGIARVAGTEHLTNVGFMMGTPAYMAPEQVLGHDIDARADLYAMGVVFYRLVTGQLPFKGETPFAMAQAQVNNPPTPVATVRAGLPAWVDEVMTRSLAKKPDDRFQSAGEFRDRLLRALAGEPMTSAYGSSAPTSLMTTPPHPMPTGGAIAPTMLSTPRTGVPAMPSGLHPSATHDAATILASGGVPGLRDPSGAVPAPPVPGNVASTPAIEPAMARPASKAADKRKKSSSVGLIAAAAVVLVAVGIGAFVMLRQPTVPPSTPPTETIPPVVTTEPALPPAPTDSAQPAAGQTPAGVSPPAAGSVAPTRGTAGVPPTAGLVPGTAAGTPTTPRGATTAPGTPGTTPPAGGVATVPSSGRGATPVGGTTTTSTTAGAAGARGAAPADDSLLAVSDVRVLVIEGRKTDDPEILLNFGGGQIVLVNRRSGTPVATIPYRSIVGATYIRARDPRWNTSLHSPSERPDVGGPLRTSKHWLALQGRDFFQIIRLEDGNVTRVLQAIESRAGIAIERPTSADRN